MGQWLADSGGIPARSDSLEMPEFTESDIGPWLQGFADELPVSVAMAPINWGPVSEANLQRRQLRHLRRADAGRSGAVAL